MGCWMSDNPRLRNPEFGTSDAQSPGQIDNLDQERRALRELIDRFDGQPATDEGHGFYRKAGRYIARPLMKPRWPGDTGY